MQDSFLNNTPDVQKETAGDPIPNYLLLKNSALPEKSLSNLNTLVQQIENCYLNNQVTPFLAGKQDSWIPHGQLFLQENAWQTWQIKCDIHHFPSGQFKSTYGVH